MRARSKDAFLRSAYSSIRYDVRLVPSPVKKRVHLFRQAILHVVLLLQQCCCCYRFHVCMCGRDSLFCTSAAGSRYIHLAVDRGVISAWGVYLATGQRKGSNILTTTILSLIVNNIIKVTSVLRV